MSATGSAGPSSPARPVDPETWDLNHWLDSMKFSNYVPNFLNEGYDRLDAVSELTEDDLVAIGVKKGHVRVIHKSIPRNEAVVAPPVVATAPPAAAAVPKAGKRGRRPKGEVKIQSTYPHFMPSGPMMRPPAPGPPPPHAQPMGMPPGNPQQPPYPYPPSMYRPPHPPSGMQGAWRPPLTPGGPPLAAAPSASHHAPPPAAPQQLQKVPTRSVPDESGEKRGRGRPRKRALEDGEAPPAKKAPKEGGAEAEDGSRPADTNASGEQKKKRGRKPRSMDVLPQMRRPSNIAPLPPHRPSFPAHGGRPGGPYNMGPPPPGGQAAAPPPPHGLPLHWGPPPAGGPPGWAMPPGGPPRGPLPGPSSTTGVAPPAGGQPLLSLPPPPMHAPWMHQPSYTYGPRPGMMMPPHGPAAPQGHGQLTGPSAAPQEDPKKEKVLASKLSKKVTKTQEKKEEPKAVANELKQTATKTAEKDKAAVLKPKKSKGAVAPDTEKEEPAQLDSKVEEEEYVCSLCGGEEHHPILGDLDGPYGDDRDGQEIWVHEDCVMWSPEFFMKDNEPQNIDKIVNRGKSLKCSHCGKKGGTIGCREPACKKSFHFRCITDSGGVRRESDYYVYCKDHMEHLADKTLAKKLSSRKSKPSAATKAPMQTPPPKKPVSPAPSSASALSRRESTRLARTSSKRSGE